MTFRWGPNEDWVMVGQTTVEPEQVGVAYVLAPDSRHADVRAQLSSETTPEAVRQAFLRTGDRPLLPISMALFTDLLSLTEHDDFRVRRETVRSLIPYVRHTASDPFASDAPTLIPEGLLLRLSEDPHPGVRRKTGALIREMGPEDPHSSEADVVLGRLLKDGNRGARRIALGVLTNRATERPGGDEPLEAWNAALARVESAGAPGRAACNGLAKLHGEVEPADVGAHGALALMLVHHPERAWRFWGAWKAEIPFDGARVEVLFGQTIGLHAGLLNHWAVENPTELADSIERWEPSEPHSERWGVVRGWLEPVASEPRLRASLGFVDTLSEPPEAPQPQ